MKKTVILSSTNNPDYLNYLPYTQKAWNKLGWNTITFLVGVPNDYQADEMNDYVYIDWVLGYRQETISQVSRLIGYKFADKNDLVMTGDVDMIPIADYWNPEPDKITVYGHDLTGYNHYPICYIAMPVETWSKIIFEDTLIDLLDKYPQAKSEDWEKWWQVDQDIITERLNKSGMPIVSIDRGKDNLTGFLAKGRIDRYDWNLTLNVENPIDAHMPRPFNKESAELILSLIK